MSNFQRLALASLCVIGGNVAPALAAQPSAQILHHESIALTARKSGLTERVSFDAFGKRFDLTLQPNERVRLALGAGESDIEPFRGEIDGLPGSWVRLTRGTNGRWQGMLSDGQEIYAIEPASDIQSMAVQPLTKTGSAPVIYRLADMILELGPAFCEVVSVDEHQKTTGLEVFKSLATEMHAQAASMPSQQITVGVVGDYEFSSYFHMLTETPREAVIARMNNVDGIFSDQVGVSVQVPTITILEDVNDPFTKMEPKELLEQTRQFRRSNSEHMTRGLTHLMTGRDLNGDTVGIAYLGTICGGDYAVSLSEGTRGLTMASLIAAHEIGHNFNAPHDGDGACATVPDTFLMAARINFNDQFSSCSLGQMQSTILTARCLTDYSPADALIQASNVQGVVNQAFSLTFDVYASGGAASENVVATAAVPTQLTLNSTTVSGGTCSSGAGTVSCNFGTVEAGSTRSVGLTLTSQSTGTYSVDLAVTSSNDSVTGNNASRVDAVVAASAPADPGLSTTANSSGGGGGGSLSYGMLGALGALVLWTRRQRRALISRARQAAR